MLEYNGLPNSTSSASCIFSPDTEQSLNKLVSQLIADDHQDQRESSRNFGFNVNATPFFMGETKPFMRAQDKMLRNDTNYNDALDKLTAFALGPDVQKGNNTYNGEVYNEVRARTARFGSYSSDASSASSIASDQGFNISGSLESCFQDQAPSRKPAYGRDGMFKHEQVPARNQVSFSHKEGYSINNALSAMLGNAAGMEENFYHARNQKQNQQQHRQYPVRTDMLPSGRQIRGSSARNVAQVHAPSLLTQCIEKASMQLRTLEKDRKKVETELSRMFPGQKFSGTNQIPINRLHTNPSRLDRLLNDMARELAKVTTLVTQMEDIRGIDLTEVRQDIQSGIELVRSLTNKRKDELLCCDVIYEQKLSEEILLDAQKLCGLTRTARTALWCAYTTLIYEEKNEANASPSGNEKQTGDSETRGEHMYPTPPSTHHLLQELFKLYEQSCVCENPKLLEKRLLTEEQHEVPVETFAAGTPPCRVA